MTRFLMLCVVAPAPMGVAMGYFDLPTPQVVVLLFAAAWWGLIVSLAGWPK